MDPPSASGTAPPPEIAVEGVPYDDENRTPPSEHILEPDNHGIRWGGNSRGGGDGRDRFEQAGCDNGRMVVIGLGLSIDIRNDRNRQRGDTRWPRRRSRG